MVVISVTSGALSDVVDTAKVCLLSSLLLAASLFYVLTRQTIGVQTNAEQLQKSADCFEARIDATYDGDYTRMWERFPSLVNYCSARLRLDGGGLREFANTDETKFHFMPQDAKTSPNCAIISLGIGKDVKVERRLAQLLPSCSFFGADPVNESNYELFTEVGKFYNMAVGHKNGSFRSYVLEEVYRYQEVAYIDLPHFIDSKVGHKVVDQLMMDIEHAEYPVLPFFEHGGVLEQRQIEICQINIEIHRPTLEDRKVFAEWLQRNAKTRQWIFVNSQIHPFFKHIRLFMINGRSSECHQRYWRDPNT